MLQHRFFSFDCSVNIVQNEHPFVEVMSVHRSSELSQLWIEWI
jgi:hypothetical protein